MRSISVYYICAVTITKAVSPFFQIQLLNVSAEPSVLTTGVYGPRPALETGVALQRRDSLIGVTKGAETRHFGTTVVLHSGTQIRMRRKVFLNN
jgi:hypothetical protein